MSRRIALLTEVPAPFRFPLFAELGTRAGLTLRVLFLSVRDPRRPYPGDLSGARFNQAVLPGHELSKAGRWIIVNRRVVVSLARLRPQVVIVGGWNQPAFWQALLWTKVARSALVIWVESTARDARSGGTLLERAKRTMINHATAFIVPGTASRHYLESLGVESRRIFTAPNAVDRTLFRYRVDELRNNLTDLRAELGIGRATILSVCRLDPEKGVDTLLRAVDGLAADLVIAGAGADAARLAAAAPAGVRFLGAVSPEELVRWYAAADVFVLASRSEQWGMVVNEAAEAALPIVTTDAVGSAADLVRDGVSGFIVPVDDVPAMRSALERLLADAPLRASAGRASRALVEPYTASAWADGVLDLAAGIAPC